MANLYNFRTGQVEDVADGDVQQALSTGTHGWKRGQPLPVLAPDGTPGTIDPSDAGQAFANGYRYDTVLDREERRKDAAYGNNPIEAGLTGAARGLSFGTSDVALRALGMSAERLREVKARNPGAEMTGEVVGIALPLLLSLGTDAPVAAGQTASLGARAIETAGAGVLGAAKLGSAVERAVSRAIPGTVENVIAQRSAALGIRATAQSVAPFVPQVSRTAKLIAEAIPRGAGSVVEGALYGAGQVVSDAALGDPDLNAQHALAKIGLSALLSGAVGASTPLVGRAVSASTSRLRNAAAKAVDPAELEHFAAQQAVKASGAMKRDFKRLGQQPGELLKVGTDALETGVVKAGDTLDSIYDKAVAATEKAGDDVGGLLQAFDAAAARSPKSTLPNMGRVVKRAQSEIVNPLLKSANPDEVRLGKQFSEWLDEFHAINQGRPATFQQAQQLRRSIDESLKWDMTKPPDALTQQKRAFRSILEDEIEDSADRLANTMNARGGAAGDLKAEYENAKRLYKSMVTIRDMAQDRIAAKDTNRMFSLTDYIGAGAGANAGAMLGGSPGAVMGFLTGFVNKFLLRERGNALLASGALRLAKLERAVNANKLGIQQGMDNFLTQGRHLLPPVAADLVDNTKGETPREGYQRRVEQIQQLQANPAQMAANFAEGARGFAEVAPEIGQQLHLRAAQAVGYLAQTIPNRPSVLASPLVPRQYQPTDLEMAAWTRRYQTAQDPTTVLRAMQAGTLTKEHIETLQAVYPGIYAQMRDAVVRALMNNEGALSYQKRLLLSRLFQAPLDPTLTPVYVQQMQANFSNDQTANSGQGPQPGTPAQAVKGAERSKTADAFMTTPQRLAQR